MAYSEKYSKKIERMLKIAVRDVLRSKPILAKDLKTESSSDLFCTRVCKPIRESSLCIVDLTYNNINVGFEYGRSLGFDKPCIITRFVFNAKQMKKGEIESLSKLKRDDKIQVSILPFNIPPDFESIFRVDYSTQKELNDKIRGAFRIKTEPRLRKLRTYRVRRFPKV